MTRCSEVCDLAGELGNRKELTQLDAFFSPAQNKKGNRGNLLWSIWDLCGNKLLSVTRDLGCSTVIKIHRRSGNLDTTAHGCVVTMKARCCPKWFLLRLLASTSHHDLELAETQSIISQICLPIQVFPFVGPGIWRQFLTFYMQQTDTMGLLNTRPNSWSSLARWPVIRFTI
eukprot:s1833_g7.t1